MDSAADKRNQEEGVPPSASISCNAARLGILFVDDVGQGRIGITLKILPTTSNKTDNNSRPLCIAYYELSYDTAKRHSEVMSILLKIIDNNVPIEEKESMLLYCFDTEPDNVLNKNFRTWELIFTAYRRSSVIQLQNTPPEMQGAGVKARRKQLEATSSSTAAGHSKSFKKTNGESSSPRPSSSKSCSESSGSRKNSSEKSEHSSNSNSRMLDVMNPEGVEGCCEGNHYECERHSHVCGSQPEAPCDCCRHGHSISSLIRPDDCRSCLRQMGGVFVSPKYPQMRQKMLKALNRRRDCSEEMDTCGWSHSTSNSVPANRHAGKKDIVLQNENSLLQDIDDLVRSIEGTKISNDPKKAAKKARQKEKKHQVKMEEERQKEEEERKKQEEEERLRREQILMEEEERRKAEELKRLARKTKKKNRKKRAAANSANPNEEIAESSKLEISVERSHMTSKLHVTEQHNKRDQLQDASSVNTRAVSLIDKSVPDVREGDAAQMVTIRRHPSQGENFVTISLKGNEGDDSLLYYLVDGQLYPKDSKQMEPRIETHISRTNIIELEENKSSKKKKKKNKTQSELTPRLINSTEAVRLLEDRPVNSPRRNFHSDVVVFEPDVDISSLQLPPGITITKVPTGGERKPSEGSNSMDRPPSQNKEALMAVDVSSHGKCLQNESFHISDIPNRNNFISTPHVIEEFKSEYDSLNDDFLIRAPETQEFEEVVSTKTRRMRNKAAKKEVDGMPEDVESLRSSPCSFPSATRRVQPECDKPMDNGSSNWTTTKPIQNGKSVRPKSNRGGLKPSNTYEKSSTTPLTRRDQSSRNAETYNRTGSINIGAKVMPRLSRLQQKSTEEALWSMEEQYRQHQKNSEEALYRALREFKPQESVPMSETDNANHQFPYLLSRLMNPKKHNENSAEINCQIEGNGYSQSRESTNQIMKARFEDSSRVPNTGQVHSSIQPAPKLWDHGEISAPALGPFTVQAKPKVNSWSPWKDWNDASTSENSSPQFGVQMSGFSPKETTTDYYGGSFQDPAKLNMARSPIQRPYHSEATETTPNSFYSRVGNSCLQAHENNGVSNEYFGHQNQGMPSNVGIRDMHLGRSPQCGLENEEHSARIMQSNESSLNSLADRSKLTPLFSGDSSMYTLPNAMKTHSPQHLSLSSGWGTENTFQTLSNNSYIPRRQSDNREFLINQTAPHLARNDVEWNQYASCSPLQESEMYNRQGFALRPPNYNSPSPMRSEPVSSETSVDKSTMWQALQNKTQTPLLRTYQNLRSAEMDWQQPQTMHLQMMSPQGPIIPPSMSPMHGNWDSERVHVNRADFPTGGAHP